ncbi:LADA_0A01992g1_1 [Lachancea dasiensis]|uniref:Sphingoid long-chain base transporter RSB1 n=1 Tax=Lachancea dasiensis TaxID=1072105 RepID=A0A1G4IMV6_9SACH|nr:LADA_0A01992g1_1 [Lachancea dasiensis]
MSSLQVTSAVPSAAAASMSAAMASASASAVAEAAENYSLYGPMNPNIAFNSAMAAIFGILFILQALAGVWTRQWWMLVSFLCACALEVIGYVGRSLSHDNTSDLNDFLLQFICLTIAPVFTMAGLYYQLGKLVEIYGHAFALLKNPMLYSYIFIVCDWISLIIQAVGGGMSGNAAANYDDTSTGDHIFVAGLAFQVASMTMFLFLWFHLLYQIFVVTRMQHVGTTKVSISLFRIPQSEIDYKYRAKFESLRLHPQRWIFRYFPWALTVSVLLVYVRCIYRVIELAEGWNGNLITHEVYFIILDALMISLATTIMTVFYPGFAFKGRSVKIPIQKDTGAREASDDANAGADSPTEALFPTEKELSSPRPASNRSSSFHSS